MSVGYRAILWTPHIRRYDAVMLGAIVCYLAVFMGVSTLTAPPEQGVSPAIMLIRAFGSCAILMLNVILCIGPLARLDRRFLPLLYNRRHLGVATFLVASVHAAVVLVWYHGFGVVGPVKSLLTSSAEYRSISAFPFELLGLLGFVILYLMAATSHDFWLHNLSKTTWKRLHMLVYVAWAALILHVALGVLQHEASVVYTVIVFGGTAIVIGLHLVAGRREVKLDAGGTGDAGEWIDVGSVEAIREGRGRPVCLKHGERIAIFRYDGKVSAMSNVCAHQGGPLGEGRIIDGCVTCPWHGYTYKPHDGAAPPPFTEKVATFRVRIQNRRILVDPRPLPPGTPVEPAVIDEAVSV